MGSSNQDTIIVLTYKSVETLLRQGGSASWTLDERRARKMKFIVCTRNRHPKYREGNEQHGEGFLIAKIRDVVPAPDEENLWLIRFSEYAELKDKQILWPKHRNPVAYTSLATLGLKPAEYQFEPVPAPLVKTDGASRQGLTLAQAKAGLSITFGVPPEAIDIVIRG